MKQFFLFSSILFFIIAAPAQTNTTTGVIAICKKKFQYMLERDSAALKNSLHNQLQYIHSSGKIDSKESLVASVTRGSTVYKKLEVFDEAARQFGNTVVVTGKLHYGAEGKDGLKEYDLLFTEVYVLQKKKWLLVSRHASKISGTL